MPAPECEEVQQTAIPDFEIEAIARCLLPVLRAFYDSPEGRMAFERWKAEHEKNAEQIAEKDAELGC